jgi:dTDP-4-dehydrorhamnose 3,5-epimerase
MKVEKTNLKGVLLIKPEPLVKGQGEIAADFRGEFTEAYNGIKYKEQGIEVEFLEDDVSVSHKNVLRGMHGDDRTWKLISCLHGKIFFVAINGDKNSPAFGAWQSFDLNEDNKHRLLVPPLYGSGYVVLSEKAIVSYKQSEYFKPGGQFTLKWNDPQFNIPWPVKEPILSDRDTAGGYVAPK